MVKSRKINLDTPQFAWVREKETQTLIKALGQGNCRFVGGVVRNSLFGKTVQDIDVATPLKPEEVMAALKIAGIKVIPTGLKHGTVSAVFKGRIFEITTLRHDVKTFGRHAEVAFHDDWEADAARRDFTINALYLSPDGTLYDYFGGEEDFKEGKVRFIGQAEKRIREDSLRILRFFRFHAWYGTGDLNPGGLQAVAGTVKLLDKLSAERVRNEFLKTLQAPDPFPVLRSMEGVGVLGHLFNGGKFNLEKLGLVVHLETGLDMTSALRRLAALITLDEKEAKNIGTRLKLSNRAQTRLAAMIAGVLPENISEKGAAREIYLNGKEVFMDRLILHGGEVSEIKSLLKFSEGFQIPNFPVGGADLERQGIKPGREMGLLLKELEARWVKSDFTLTKEQLLKKVS
ncbi:MAG: CCA tRNA nucleotidyltransferase [Sphingomonadales bacterium]